MYKFYINYICPGKSNLKLDFQDLHIARFDVETRGEGRKIHIMPTTNRQKRHSYHRQHGTDKTDTQTERRQTDGDQ
jgi:hypothetical protein